jgi:hypothetical protein
MQQCMRDTAVYSGAVIYTIRIGQQLTSAADPSMRRLLAGRVREKPPACRPAHNAYALLTQG